MSLVWKQKKISMSASICITSPVAIIEALEKMGCTVHTQLTANKAAAAARNYLDKCLAELETLAPMSLERATEYEQMTQKTIDASNDLMTKLQSASKEIPDTIQVTDSNGINRTLKRRAGAYIVEWTETESTSNYGDRRYSIDSHSRSFSDSLIKTSEDLQEERVTEQKRVTDVTKQKNAELHTQLTKAMGIRKKWELIEDNKRIQNLREERASEIEERGKNMGFSCKRVVNNKKEIVISMRRRV